MLSRSQIVARTIHGALPFDILSRPRAKHAMHYSASHKRLPLDQLSYAGIDLCFHILLIFARTVRQGYSGRVIVLWARYSAVPFPHAERTGLHATPVACPSGHSLRECSLRHPASAVQPALE